MTELALPLTAKKRPSTAQSSTHMIYTGLQTEVMQIHNSYTYKG